MLLTILGTAYIQCTAFVQQRLDGERELCESIEDRRAAHYVHKLGMVAT